MKYTITIVVCAVLFAIIGLLAGWGVSVYGMNPSSSHRDEAVLAFTLLPLGGAVAGLVVGCLAACLGKWLTGN